jgi:simple sugar transport system permease protein
MILKYKKLISLFIPFSAILSAFLIGAVMILMVKVNPLEAYRVLFRGALGDFRSVTDTLVKACPLIFTALSFAFAARCNVYNIGAEGQLYMGALASVAVGIYVKGLPVFLHLPLGILAGGAAGAVWASLAAVIKIKKGVSEVVTTIMLNYIAILIPSALVYGPMIENAIRSPQPREVMTSALLPVLFTRTKLHGGIILALAAIVVYHIIYRHTAFGFKLAAVGYNNVAARFSGINTGRNMFLSMLISGFLAGLAGTTEMLGTNHRLIIGFSNNFGFDGIAIALLGRRSPLGIFLSAILFGALRMGATSMQRSTDVPMQIVTIIQGIIILFVLAGEVYQNILQRWLEKRKEAKNA